MKNSLLELIICILSITSLNGQNNSIEKEFNHIRQYCCASNLNIPTNLGVKNIYLIDEIFNDSNNIPFKKYVTDRNLLKKIKVKVCFEDEILLIDSSDFIFSLHATSSMKKISQFNEVIIDSIDNIKLITSLGRKKAFGLGNYEDNVKVFDKFEVKINKRKIDIPDSALNDLFFPNFCNIDNSIKPIEGFVSKDKKNLYVYIFGLHEVGKNHTLGTVSYMCKLIFNKNGYVGRIISNLSGYKWQFCNTFIGF